MVHTTQANPLDPQVLRAAGVPLDEALWFTKLPVDRKIPALMCSQMGRRILHRVRQHFGVPANAGAFEWAA